jgi:hypothetical protein
MIPVRTQNKHEPANGEWGDCLRASLASILEVPIDEVPHFMDGGPSAGDLDAAMAGWLELRGLGQVVIHAPGELAAILKNLETVAPEAFYLLGGTSRNGLEHCVVGCGGAIAHDPSDAGIVGPLSNGHYRIVFLTPFARRSAALKAAALPAPAIDTTPLGRHSKVGVMFSGGKDSCSYMNDAANKFADGPCLMRTSEVNGKFAYTLTFGDGTRVVVEYVASQSGYHIWKINGQSGFGVEVNRQHVKGATLDLKQTVEWDSSSSARR